MPRLLAPLLCLTLLPALAARGRRPRARNFARPFGNFGCALRALWVDGSEGPAARVGGQSGRIGHAGLVFRRVSPGGLSLLLASEEVGSSVCGAASSGPRGPVGPPGFALGQTRLGLAVGADRLPAPATFRFESDRFWFPVASWDHLFSSGADVGALSVRSGVLCSRCLARGGDGVSRSLSTSRTLTFEERRCAGGLLPRVGGGTDSLWKFGNTARTEIGTRAGASDFRRCFTKRETLIVTNCTLSQ